MAVLVLLGAVLRIWGLDNVGLHGDEKTMVFPVLAILNDGGPYFPSGMYYIRAMTQLYLMAGSVWVFGDNEWALRFPSAVVGSLIPLLAYFMGRRFLSRHFNLAFVAVTAFLPAMIVYAQTARMYVFFVAAAMLFCILIFSWERKDTIGSLVAAMLAWLFALEIHVLAILIAPLFLFPGLIKQSWKNLAEGVIAIGLSVLAFRFHSQRIESHYPHGQRPALDVATESAPDVTAIQAFSDQFPWLVILGAAAVAATAASCGFVAWRRHWFPAMAMLLVGLGMAACTMFQYHIGILAILFGAIIWVRATDYSMVPLAVVVVFVFGLAAYQGYLLHQTGDFPGRKIIGAFVGTPSVWPILRFAEFSPIGFALYGIVILYCIRELFARRRIPDHFLFFAMAVWAPLLAIGVQTWYLPPRYTVGALPFFLLACVAGLEFLIRTWMKDRPGTGIRRIAAISAPAILAVLIVNPIALAAVANSGYERNPDHKGAAEFLIDLPITGEDIVIAEDVMQQVYYLGDKVDYWLRSIDNAQSYLVVSDDLPVDQYTATPHLGTGDALLDLLNENSGNRIFIIGSGEIMPERDEWARNRGISEVLESDQLRVIYAGRDGITKIWSNRTDPKTSIEKSSLP